MKFAKSLLRNQVPEWSEYYIDYKALKKLVNQAAAAPEGTERETASQPFFFQLDRNAEIVDTFFNSRFAEYMRRLKHVTERLPKGSPSPTGSSAPTLDIRLLDADELSELVSGLLELRSQFRKLAWYAEVNKRGFVKILKKFDKHCRAHTQTRYLTSKIFILPFADGQQVSEKINQASSILQEISPNVDLENGLANLKFGASAEALPIDVPAEFVAAIDNGDDEKLKSLFASSPMPSQKTLSRLLLRALAGNKAIDTVLGHYNIKSSCELHNRNIIHKLVIQCRNPSNLPKLKAGFHHPSPSLPDEAEEIDVDEIALGNPYQQLVRLLDHLTEDMHEAVVALDDMMRAPLHYAAIYGLPQVSEILISKMSEWELLTSSQGILSMEFKDAEGLGPIHYSVRNNHPVTTEKMLKEGVPPTEATKSILNPFLLVATRLNSVKMLKALLDFGLDINYQNSKGESALYTAAKYNYLASAKLLIASKADLELEEYTFGWTALFVAAVDGSTEIVDLLLDAGCVSTGLDQSGWSAKEHAALRGHIKLSEKLELPSESPTLVAKRETTPPESGASDSLKQRRSTVPKDIIKSFGHRYLEDPDTVMVLVTLSSHDLRQTRRCVEFASLNMSQAGSTELDTALSLVVSSTGHGEPVVLDLPAPEFGVSTETIAFTTADLANTAIYFDLVPTYSPKRPVLGRAVGMLSSIVKPVGNMENLNESMVVPILEQGTLAILGTVMFSFQVVRPFKHASVGIETTSTYWKSLTTSRVIGHRGLGKNTLSQRSLQLGENTVESFIQAANLGASYVEFDVQLTRDLVPVIYHDFVVGDSGFDIPMHNLSLEQFMNINMPQATQTQEESSKPRRSMSLYDSRQSFMEMHRMALTKDFKAKGFKGNVRGHSIQSKFATLEELFKTLPASVGFNIECKYPMLDEAEAEDMDQIVLEKNVWVDTVLKMVYDLKGDRDIIFSSFNPDICVLLSLKQPSIPVLFLTEGGTAPMMDVRASSLQEAIRFAKRWNLLGIVCESTPIVACPRLAQVVKQSGLVCFTYGVLNNQPDLARRQLKAGVDAVIVDSVLAVRKELTSDEGIVF
ncbi:Glycerophosphodiester phosphodiesterase GDE1 [Wickerhamiella sorbophila]|uniref:Glycerophosphodiester phosphodiesterase GDE1 n=1 Tax=Wickerhamiella sorbophila TaxID=45607 RepID=A0A2T0FC71_9ASCO|nr:Glycerophosphodiester phosphodiesterase GDE1 [Wickerhamiella sorbophila]PRT52598.1 Glycerophosphodiester phosphodiesterase GDE1 [Wickerhamiella sorbophila]